MNGIILGVPATIVDLNQKGLLERAFHDGLVPNFTYRAEATVEEWPVNSGTEIFMTRPGMLRPKTKPLAPNTDPIPQNVPYEQWAARLGRYADTIDTHAPTSATSNASLFLRNIHMLGIAAAQSINRVSRNELFKAYLQGNTVTTDAALATDTSIRVASLNGFTDVVIPGTNTRPEAPSASRPLAITIRQGANINQNQVINFTPANPADPFGPGTLQLSTPVGFAFPARSAVLSLYRTRVVRSSGGDTIDAIGPADTLTLQQIINAVAFLRDANVMPHDDGFYHAHISPLANAQIFADPVYQRLNQSLPKGDAYTRGFIGDISGVAFFMNNEAPNDRNTGDRTATGALSYYSEDIGAETTNAAGTNIGRVMITGKGIMYERWLNESAYVTEAGVTGKVGEFSVINNGINILTERIRLILRSPLDRLQDKIAASYSITTCFPIPSDVTAGSGPERFKRGIVLEHAL